MTEKEEEHYCELYDKGQDKLARIVMELEDIIDANETYMQEESDRMKKLEAENEAMKAEIEEWYRPKKGHPIKGMDRDVGFFINQYEGYTREMVLIEAYKLKMGLYGLREEIQNLKGDQG